MFDGIHTVFQRHADALRRFDVGSDLIAERMGFVADGFYHLRFHFEFARYAFFFRIEHAAGDHQLDQVDVLAFCFLHMGDGRVDALRCDGYGSCHVSARYGDSLICGKDSRACLFSGFNFIAQPRIESSKPSDGADRSDTAQ